jgi:hypothetical protein
MNRQHNLCYGEDPPFTRWGSGDSIFEIWDLITFAPTIVWVEKGAIFSVSAPLAEKVDTSAERTDTQKAFAIIMPSISDYCKEFAIAISKDPRYD